MEFVDAARAWASPPGENEAMALNADFLAATAGKPEISS